MKKIVKVAVCAVFLFSVTACGGKGSEDIAKDVLSKIDKAGWKIEHDPEAGTEVDDLDLIINKNVYFSLTLYKDNKSVETISYNNFNVDNHDKESLGYNTESKKDDSYVAYGDTTCIYNIEKEEVNETVSTMSNCNRDANKNIKTLQKARDKALDKANISLDDLFVWSKWYHEQNDES